MLQFFPDGWIHYLLGGLLIGSGVPLSFLFVGRATGMSSVSGAGWSFISKRAFWPRVTGGGWRWAVLSR